MKDTKEIKHPQLSICTFGGFDINLEDQSLLEELGKSYKILELLKYFITFKDKMLLPETILENLQPENEFEDPKNVLRTQIFRLRQVLKKIVPDNDGAKYFNITSANGYYIFELGQYSILDVDEFEKLLAKANRVRESNPDEAAIIYRNAINLYTGHYLSESSSSIWAVPIRNYYQRLYIQTLFRLIDILNDGNDYSQIVDICEDALKIEPYEEALHLYFLEALLKLGHIKYALSHYEYMESVLTSELGVKPSSAMKSIYRKIQSYNDENEQINLSYIKTKLDKEPEEGALACDMEYFRFLYNIRKRNSERTENPEYMCLITLHSRSLDNNPDEASKSLKDVLKTSLRKGDVFSFWNDTQALVLLSGARGDWLEAIKERLKKDFHSNHRHLAVELDIRFMPVTSRELPELLLV